MHIPSIRSVGVFAMLALLSSLLGAKTAPDAFPRLSDNTAGSATLEVRKLLHGQVDGLFVVPRTRQVVAAAGGHLWKFTDQGVLLDTVYARGGMFASGLMFSPEGYVDWVFTGHAQRKPYGPQVDGNGLTPAQVVAALQQAEVVEFAKNDQGAWAYLWQGGKGWKMDVSRHRELVDTSCRRHSRVLEALRWPATCFKGLAPAPALWTEVEPGSFEGYGQPQPRAEVVRFDRRKYHLEEGLSGQLFGATVGVVLKSMGVPGSLPGRYWFGDAHTRVRVGPGSNDVVQFKAFVPYEDGKYRFLYNMQWWEPAAALPGASPWFSVHMRSYMESAGEEELLKYYEKDIGLYAVRPRGEADVPLAQRTSPAWRPVFEGPSTRHVAVQGTVEFDPAATNAAGQSVAALPPAHQWLRPPLLRTMPDMPPVVPVNALWPALHQLPSVITARWHVPGDDDGYAVLRITLQPEQVQAAMARVQAHPQGQASQGARARRGPPPDPAPLELLLRLPPGAAGATRIDPALVEQLQVLVRSPASANPGARNAAPPLEVPLAQVQWEWVVRPAVPPVRVSSPVGEAPPPPPAYLALMKPLEAAKETAVPKGAAGLSAFLQQAQALVQHPQYAENAPSLAPRITEAYADVLNRFNNLRQLGSSATLVRHYLAQVHPHTSSVQADSSLAYNQGVIASQTLAFAIHMPEHRDLLDAVMTQLLAPPFDVQQQRNGTLAYNLACYHAVQGDKPRLLQAASAASRLGKPRAQFLADTDFERYWQDADFLQALQPAQ
ncbi:MAG: hypothetical protein O9331_02440 [Acidovorax sp.]|nr:hypothetical protein [Acidovorax sp.]